jgi:hypothetical protein
MANEVFVFYIFVNYIQCFTAIHPGSLYKFPIFHIIIIGLLSGRLARAHLARAPVAGSEHPGKLSVWQAALADSNTSWMPAYNHAC